jgi:hypothetical protein
MSAAARNKKIRTLILRGIYDVADIRIRKNSILQLFVAFWISFLTPLISLQSDTWAESYG